ncbi:MAG TPA: hypothetical protein VHR18_00445 [Solirubrobacterales bacterium]|jgi:hypothetical protein|nr:hypothetical protein [Solirubrobacterales bacterium]
MPRSRIAGAIVNKPTDETSTDPKTGAVTSRQGADIILPATAAAELWKPANLERLARTYWSTMRRFTLGLTHVHYSESERSVVLLIPQLPLLTFQAPEYDLESDRGVVRWRIDRGVLVSKRGRGGDGYLKIEVERHAEPDPERTRLHVAVEVANYYPALSGFGRWLYANTQSRIHVLACNFFLRRLVRRDLSPLRTGRESIWAG